MIRLETLLPTVMETRYPERFAYRVEIRINLQEYDKCETKEFQALQPRCPSGMHTTLTQEEREVFLLKVMFYQARHFRVKSRRPILAGVLAGREPVNLVEFSAI